MLIAEDLLLLLTEDQTGKLLVASTKVDVALGGAMLIELALAQRVDIAREDGTVRKGRLFVADASPTSDPLLDEALRRIEAKQGKKPRDVVAGLGKGLQEQLHARLSERGLLREETAKVLGIFPMRRWPTTDTASEDSTRALVEEALRLGATFDPRIAAVVSLLRALKVVAKVVDPASLRMSKREVNANAERIADGDWASEAVRQAIDAALAAVIASTSSSSVVLSGG